MQKKKKKDQQISNKKECGIDIVYNTIKLRNIMQSGRS